ncbi:hypothetical protein MHUMG1_08651 [Metarhizium humberi]|uniref:Uncharacterized protein n=1 Tax=Metarhizium humberi TaxID=2596975 RepID=A0A9P8M4A3_9HYPO|nr:hypothetical protein MHUMG1_08651 [Metarhizium humberi]
MSAGSSGAEAVPLHKATPEQLENEFFPPRPDPERAPEQFKLWQEILRRNIKRLPPKHPPELGKTKSLSRVGVESGFEVYQGKIKDESKFHHAAILFRGPNEQPMSYYNFNKDFVEPGDLITAYVCCKPDRKIGKATLFNEAKNIHGGGVVKAPEPGVVVEGQNGEWIISGKNPDEKKYTMPHYGATAFFNEFVTRKEKREQSMSEAMLGDGVITALQTLGEKFRKEKTPSMLLPIKQTNKAFCFSTRRIGK